MGVGQHISAVVADVEGGERAVRSDPADLGRRRRVVDDDHALERDWAGETGAGEDAAVAADVDAQLQSLWSSEEAEERRVGERGLGERCPSPRRALIGVQGSQQRPPGFGAVFAAVRLDGQQQGAVKVAVDERS